MATTLMPTFSAHAELPALSLRGAAQDALTESLRSRLAGADFGRPGRRATPPPVRMPILQPPTDLDPTIVDPAPTDLDAKMIYPPAERATAVAPLDRPHPGAGK